MTEAKDTKGLTEVVDAILTGISVFKQAEADGKIDLSDLGLLLQLVPVVGPAISDASDIPAELKDLSTEEAAALVAHVMVKLSLGNEHAQAVATEALKFAAQGFALYKAISAPVATPA